MTKVLQLTLTKREAAARDAVIFHFHQPKVHRIWYQAGQYLTLGVEVDGARLFRAYSLCSAPRYDDTLAIAVKRLPGGKVSNWLIDHANVGDSFGAIRPTGKFVLDTSVKNRRQIWLVGGGSGMTPLFSMLKAALFDEPDTFVSLITVNRTAEDLFFQGKIRALEKIFPKRLQSRHFVSREASSRPGFASGRPDAARFEALFREFARPELEENRVFLCGPEGLMDAAEAGFRSQGLAAESIQREYFYRDTTSEAARRLTQPPSSVTVDIADTAYTFRVVPGATILDAAISQHVPIPYSCRSGECATCLAKIHTGEAEMAYNEMLTDGEIEEGYVLTCQAFPLTETVALELSEGM